MKTIYIFVGTWIFLLILYSCNRNQTSTNDSDKTISTTTKPVEKLKEKEKQVYPFVDELHNNGFKTDTNRLKTLSTYVYRDLRNSSFIEKNRVLLNELKIEESFVLRMEASAQKDSLFRSSLSNGVGFFFCMVDSNEIGIKNTFDFGMEIWDFSGADTAQIIKDWKFAYHPMPLEIVVRGNQMYVFYTRMTANYQSLLKCKEIILENM